MEVWTLARAKARHFYEARGAVAVRQGAFVVADHREPAVGYVLDLSAARGAGRGPSTPAR